MSLAGDLEAAIARAAAEIAGGRLVVFPTDTVYAVGADAFNAFATTMIFQAKGRPRSLPLPVLVATPAGAWALTARVPPGATALAERFWPGPLTIVLPEQEGMAWELGETGGRVAVRIPDHQDALRLIERTGPLAATSANVTGEPTPRTAAEIAGRLGHAISLYLDGGPSPREVPSTIVDLAGERPSLVREGVIGRAELERVLGTAL
ncbi:MAG: threonylcarbamoyl-AMP synthase [Acidobacteria bacterium]|nr:threonylcarbamoyl-AMP synthase [Acidobacteriota bacterium]